MRWLAGIAVVLVATGLVGAQMGAPPERVARPLLPDLDQAPPQAISIRREGRRSLLVFGSAVDNVGAGPLLVNGRRSSRSAPAMATRQTIARSDGSRVYRDLGSLLHYEHARTHSHWHLHRFAVYELRSADGSNRLLRSRKAGFCLGDRYETNRFVRLLGEPAAAVWTHECGRGQPGRLAIDEGISVGYGDDYAPFLEGQFVDVTALALGRYLLVHRANPRHVLRESDYRNNASSVLVRLRRSATGAMTVRVLARCPGTVVCPA
jgi:Lysyl oxidase